MCAHWATQEVLGCARPLRTVPCHTVTLGQAAGWVGRGELDVDVLLELDVGVDVLLELDVGVDVLLPSDLRVGDVVFGLAWSVLWLAE